MSNPYTERACALMKWREGEEPFANIPLPPTPLASAEAQVNATLALAYEQRTANLIAYQRNVEDSYTQQRKDDRSPGANALNEEIKERLEL